MMILKIVLALITFYGAWQISNPYLIRKRWKENMWTFVMLAALAALILIFILPLLKQ